MKCITVKELYRNTESYLDKEITVAGWLRSNRGSKAFGFLVMGDGSCFQTLQIVYHDNMENFKEVSKLNVGAAVIVKGTLVATPEAKQPFEIQAEEVVVEGDSAAAGFLAAHPVGTYIETNGYDPSDYGGEWHMVPSIGPYTWLRTK